MAGIRQIGDLDRNQDRQRPFVEQQDQRTNVPLLGAGFRIGTPDEARKETFWQMLKNIFCPFFSTYSFIFIITIIDILIYFITVFYDYNTSAFLEPKVSTLDLFGDKDSAKMKDDVQLWRWFTPMLLHANLTHIVYNVIMQLILGFRLEPTVGHWRTVAIYVTSGVGGVLFSCLCTPDVNAVGASTSIFGILSSMIMWLIMNWNALENNQFKIITLIWLIMLLLFNFLFGFVSFMQSIAMVDNLGHLGGMITGFFVGMIVFKLIEPGNEKMWRMIGGGLLGFYFILGFTLFYTVVQV